MFRELIPLLADRFHLVAPDLPGFGRPDMPARGDGYTFEHIADVIDRAYTEGLSDAWNPVQAHWKDPSEVTREAIRIFLAPQTTIWRYTHGVPDSVRVSPDGYGLENYYLARSGADEIQLDLFLDYASNVALYPSSTSHQQAAAARGVGQERSVLPAGRS